MVLCKKRSSSIYRPLKTACYFVQVKDKTEEKNQKCRDLAGYNNYFSFISICTSLIQCSGEIKEVTIFTCCDFPHGHKYWRGRPGGRGGKKRRKKRKKGSQDSMGKCYVVLPRLLCASASDSHGDYVRRETETCCCL